MLKRFLTPDHTKIQRFGFQWSSEDEKAFFFLLLFVGFFIF